MSYDLMVFDPGFAPRDRETFQAWFQEQTDWSEGDEVFDPANTSIVLQGWYKAMVDRWPDMQTVGDDQVDNPRVTGYSFVTHSIYLDFRWSVAEEAYDTVRNLAVQHKIGFYDVSGDEGNGEIYFPGDMLRPPSGGAWRDVTKQFQTIDTNAGAPKKRWFDFLRRRK